MYVSPWTQAALMPPHWKVCGMKISPLSLWHAYILGRAGNAFVCGGEPDADSAAQVLVYCAGGIAHARRYYVSQGYRDLVDGRVARRIRRTGTDKAIGQVSDYIDACCRIPGHKETLRVAEGYRTRKIAAPLEWVIAEYLCRSGIAADIDRAFDTCYSVARCLFDAARDAAGEVESLIDETAEERIDKKLGVA